MERKPIKPIFQCRKCNKFFVRSSPGPTSCVFCNNIYVDWLNYDEVINSLPEDWRLKTLEEVWLK